MWDTPPTTSAGLTSFSQRPRSSGTLRLPLPVIQGVSRSPVSMCPIDVLKRPTTRRHPWDALALKWAVKLQILRPRRHGGTAADVRFHTGSVGSQVAKEA